MRLWRRLCWLAATGLVAALTPPSASSALATGAPAVWGYAWANDPTNPSCYAAPQVGTATSGGTWVTVCRTGTGRYSARFVGLGEATAGVAQVAAYGTHDWCEIGSLPTQSQGDELVGVDCFAPGGNADDAEFVLSYTQALGVTVSTGAFAYLTSPSGPSENSAAGTNSVSPHGGGSYTVTMAGVGMSGGDVQVSAGGGAGERCVVVSWAPVASDEVLGVQCYDRTGSAADSAFVVTFADRVSLLGPALDHFGYAWSSPAASPSSPPSATYSFDTEGGSLAESQTGPGSYSLTVPGLGPDGSVMVTAYGATAGGYCAIRAWGSATFEVDCYDATGSPANEQFTLSIVRTAQTVFYFAEGFTGTGFQTVLLLFMPNHSGTAVITYFIENGATVNRTAALTAGRVTTVDVNAAVGPGHAVSALVLLPFPGVAERVMHFQFGSWHGSTDEVGVQAPSTEWDFAEGSTLTFFTEYLSLQNPGNVTANATLSYFDDDGTTPVKTLSLPPDSRTTVEVFNGSANQNAIGCVPNGGGADCGVGLGIQGVSVKVTADQPIVAERPMYVNGLSYGSAAIRSGHDVFGTNHAATTWSFAEGNTLPGFNEYLTIQNPNPGAFTAQLTYFDDNGTTPVKSVRIPASSRVTVEVWNGDTTSPAGPCNPSGLGADCGVGAGIQGVSVQVISPQPIVVERPMYVAQDFGSGLVAGAHDVMGAKSTGTLFGFAAASTVSGENDYLTIQNTGGAAVSVTITYYGSSGAISPAPTVSVPAMSRVTVVVSGGSAAAPTGIANLGIILQATGGVLIEKPTYNSTTASYGATDAIGYSPPAGF